MYHRQLLDERREAGSNNLAFFPAVADYRWESAFVVDGAALISDSPQGREGGGASFEDLLSGLTVLPVLFLMPCTLGLLAGQI